MIHMVENPGWTSRVKLWDNQRKRSLCCVSECKNPKKVDKHQFGPFCKISSRKRRAGYRKRRPPVPSPGSTTSWNRPWKNKVRASQLPTTTSSTTTKLRVKNYTYYHESDKLI